MNQTAQNQPVVTLDQRLTLDQFMTIVRGEARISFSPAYEKRVRHSTAIVQALVEEGRIVYGVTTGFGSNSTQVISTEDAATLQENILLSHATSLGAPMTEPVVRATLLMMLCNGGQGHSGVRLETLERIAWFLNEGLYPFAPAEGSVGYLSPEAHISLALTGKGSFLVGGAVVPAAEVFARVGLKPYPLSYKEGLFLISGTTSVTGFAAVALDRMLQAVVSADLIAAMTLEVSKATLKAFDPRVMGVRRQSWQGETAAQLLRILGDSEICRHFLDYRLQDALSLRCVPQLHGTAKKRLYGIRETLEDEFASCCDNPITWGTPEEPLAISSGNPDSSYVGMEMDTAAIAAAMVAKMSERRTNRLIDGSISGNPYFLVSQPGLNSGLMITQYTQAGLLNDMKRLSLPAVVDNIPTCANQEDYVAMGYNAAKKALECAEKLEQILAIELLAAYQSYPYLPQDLARSQTTEALCQLIATKVPLLREDVFLYPHIQSLISLINSGALRRTAENILGPLV